MNKYAQTKPVAQVVAAIEALDLDPIKFKLMDREEGHGWTRDYADRMEVEYKRFLTLLTKYPDASIAPSKDVDKFWHGHILDTLKYATDCEQVFGYFLHHFPYFGMRGADDAANLAAAADTMHALYQQEFGAQQTTAPSFCGVAKEAVSFCGVAKQAVSFCGVAKQAVSFCGVAKQAVSFCGAAKQAVSFCGVAKQAASFCGAAKQSVSFCGAAKQAVSFCGVAKQAPSFCGVAKEAVSFCGVAKQADSSQHGGREAILNVDCRPTLS